MINRLLLNRSPWKPLCWQTLCLTWFRLIPSRLNGARSVTFCFRAMASTVLMGLLVIPANVLAQSASLITADDLLQIEEAAVKKAIALVSPMVVQIETIGGDSRDGGTSSGTVVSADGLVLTAAYNLRHEPTNIFVKAVVAGETTPTRLVAQIVATDHSRQLCLLKTNLADDQRLTPVTVADQEALRVGSTAIAAGKVHDATAPSISVGIVSATGRIWGRAIQTDAKISKVNYGGPLINLRGQTIGVLLPLSPDDSSVEAGAEWYDSGIGFAIPLEGYSRSIQRLGEGVDLHQGLLGVSLKGKDLYADWPEIDYCSPKSPASQSGLLPGDRIVSIDQQPVASESQLKHALGVKYAGDEVIVTVDRGGRAITVEATLAENIEPFEELAIGIIPDHGNDLGPAKVGVVLPQSPAEDADLVVGDIISAIGTEAITKWDDFQSAINRRSPGETVSVVVRNEGKTNPSTSTTKEISLVRLTASLPPVVDEVPAAATPEEALQGNDVKKQAGENPDPQPKGDTVEVEQISLSVAGFANRCTAYLPSPDRRRSFGRHAVLVWVTIPGTDDLSQIKSAVASTVQRTGLVVVVPQSLNANQWSPEESEFIVKAMGRLKRKITVDPNRIAIGGQSTAAMMGCLTAFLHRDTFRGLIMLDSLFPARTPSIETRPDQRLMILLATSGSFTELKKLQKMKTVIENRKFPVYHHQVSTQSLADLMPLFGAWVDAVDRR